MRSIRVWQAASLCALVLCAARPAWATIQVDLGDHVLNYNGLTTIDVFVTGLPSDYGTALELYMTVNSGVGPAPLVTSIDVSSPGTIFGDLASDLFGPFYFPPPNGVPSLTPALVTYPLDFSNVPMNGLMARVTFDTTGLADYGPFLWSISNHEFGPTDFGVNSDFEFIYGDLIDGHLTVLPEPGSLMLGLVAAAALTGFSATRLLRRAK